MKRLHIFIYIIAVASCFIACSSDKDDYAAGPEAPEGNIGAYIVGDYETQTVFGDQPVTDTIWINVARRDTVAAAKIPVTADVSDTAIHVAEYAEFANNQKTTTIAVTCPYITIKQKYNVGIKLADSYCDPYADVDGGSTAEFSIVWADWEPLTNDKLYKEAAGNGLLTYSEDSTLVLDSLLYYANSYVGGKVEHIPGLNRFRITDFFGSGIPLDFSLSNYNADEPAESNGKITINGNVYVAPTAYGNYYAWGKLGWDPWTPTGFSRETTAIYFYLDYNGGAYNNINLNIDTPATTRFKSKPGVTYISEGNNNYYGVELTTINSGWYYVYFYMYYRVKAKNAL